MKRRIRLTEGHIMRMVENVLRSLYEGDVIDANTPMDNFLKARKRKDNADKNIGGRHYSTWSKEDEEEYNDAHSKYDSAKKAYDAAYKGKKQTGYNGWG